ncbi:MAG TPA: hypothetical protein VF765_07980, partial [Polyangiaceae bacterium]
VVGDGSVAGLDAAVPIPMGQGWYVTPNGTSGGDGSMSNPWDIVTALNGPSAVKPGDTIWVRAGKYGGGMANSVISSHLVGTSASPILVRAYPKERVTIDAWLQVGCCDGAPDPTAGSYTWFWGLEFAGFNTDRTSGTSGPPQWAAQANHNSADTWGAGTRFIDDIIHDTGGGLSVWNAAGSELYGNIVFDVGGYGTDRGHGHDFYLQNQAPAVLEVTDNIGFDNFDMGIQAYGSSDAYVQNIHLTGNVVFNSGILYYGHPVDNVTIGGGGTGPSGIVLDSNAFYDTPSMNLGYNELGFLWTARSNDAVATSNYFIGGQQAVDLERWDSLTFKDNTIYASANDESMLITRDDQSASKYDTGGNHYYGSGQFTVYSSCDNWPCPNPSQVMDFATWKSSTGLDQTSTFTSGAPTGVWTTVRANPYDLGRANIVVFNWDMATTVGVDVNAIGLKTGDAYEIRDAENWYAGPVAKGTFTGAPVSIPMTGLTVVQPVGTVPYAPSHTAPQFGVFVFLSGESLKNTY